MSLNRLNCAGTSDPEKDNIQTTNTATQGIRTPACYPVEPSRHGIYYGVRTVCVGSYLYLLILVSVLMTNFKQWCCYISRYTGRHYMIVSSPQNSLTHPQYSTVIHKLNAGCNSGVGNVRVIPRFHPMSVGWNLGLTREFPAPRSSCCM